MWSVIDIATLLLLNRKNQRSWGTVGVCVVRSLWLLTAPLHLVALPALLAAHSTPTDWIVRTKTQLQQQHLFLMMPSKTQTTLLWVALIIFSVVSASGVRHKLDSDDDSTDELQTHSVHGRIRIPNAFQRIQGDPETAQTTPTASKAQLYSQMRVRLGGDVMVAIPSTTGTFTFHNVSVGAYTLEVDSLQFVFPPMRVDVSRRSPNVKVTAALTRTNLGHPAKIKPTNHAQYFQIRPPVNYAAFLKNPMMLMLLFSGFMAVVMPKMMEGVDPEELKRMQKTSMKDILTGNVPDPTVEDRARGQSTVQRRREQ